MAQVRARQVLELALHGFRMHPVVVLWEIAPRRHGHEGDQHEQEYGANKRSPDCVTPHMYPCFPAP